MDTLELIQRLGLALAIGLLIGLERGWRDRDARSGSRTGGIRTYALIALLGGLWGALTPMFGPVPLAAAAIAFSIAFTLFQWRETAAKGEFSVTSTIAGFIVFALGAFTILGSPTVAAAAGVATVTLLALRHPLHEFLERLSWPELRSAVLLLAMTFVALPLLPDRALDPWNAFNPHELWLLTVLIAAISFAGYVAVRIMGERLGLLLSSVAGAIVSSTTVTLNNSRLAAQGDAGAHTMLVLGVLAAWCTSLFRMAALAVGLNSILLRPLVPPILAALSVLAVAGIFFSLRSARKTDTSKSPFQNPLDLKFVFGLGALISVVVVTAKLVSDYFGQAGLFGLALISGFVDVDPVTLSSAKLAGQSVTALSAAQAILLAAAANMSTKIAATWIGGRQFALPLTISGILAVIAGAAALFMAEG